MFGTSVHLVVFCCYNMEFLTRLWDEDRWIVARREDATQSHTEAKGCVTLGIFLPTVGCFWPLVTFDSKHSRNLAAGGGGGW